MIVFVFGSVITGLIASLFALFAGASVLTAVAIYVLTGVLGLSCVFARAAICCHIKKAETAPATDPQTV